VSARRAPSESPASSFRNLSDERLGQVFLKVRAFVSAKAGKLGKVRPLVSCSDIFLLRRTNRNYLGDRAFMHMGHYPSTICMVRQAASLSDAHLVGLFLHEFGHLGGGVDEPAANAWVKRVLGIEIAYKGPMDLQWVGREVVSRILG
jgi:hypothetical protein